jgi:divalent metal cation (Fe/Co/Zn/Cd) transporter
MDLMASDPLRQALRLSYVAFAWTAMSGVAALVGGVTSSSTALVGTGADVLADMVSSAVLIWRFRGELAGHPASNRLERGAEVTAAIALLVVGSGIAVTALLRLLGHSKASPNGLALATAVASVVVLPAFVAWKYRVAARVPSPALRMDGHISLVGAAMAGITLIGLVVTAMWDWPQADPVAGILVAIAAVVVAGLSLFGTSGANSPVTGDRHP